MKKLIPTQLIKNNKYYIIWCHCWYEARLKTIATSIDDDLYVFSTKQGDIHLYYSQKHSKWQWQNPLIFENRFDAVLEVGLQIFRGFGIRRKPYTQDRHIDLCVKYVPEKMI